MGPDELWGFDGSDTSLSVGELTEPSGLTDWEDPEQANEELLRAQVSTPLCLADCDNEDLPVG